MDQWSAADDLIRAGGVTGLVPEPLMGVGRVARQDARCPPHHVAPVRGRQSAAGGTLRGMRVGS